MNIIPKNLIIAESWNPTDRGEGNIHIVMKAADAYDDKIFDIFPEWKAYLRPTFKNEHASLADPTKENILPEDIIPLKIPNGEGLYTLVLRIQVSETHCERLRLILTNETAQAFMSDYSLPLNSLIPSSEYIQSLGYDEDMPVSVDGVIGLSSDKAQILQWWELSENYQEHCAVASKHLTADIKNVYFEKIPDQVHYPIFSALLYYPKKDTYVLEYFDLAGTTSLDDKINRANEIRSDSRTH